MCGASLSEISRVERSAIEQACLGLFHRIAICADNGFRGYLDIFSEDVEWSLPGKVLRGRAEVGELTKSELLRRAVPESQPRVTRHLFTTTQVDIIDGETAEGIAYALVLTGKSPDGSLPVPVGRELLAEYTCRFEKIGDEWKIARHQVKFIFKRRN